MNWRKIWYFIWKEDSWSSWIVNVILAIVIVKFVIYPGLGFLLGTSYPVVAVVSCSMQHEASNCWSDCYMKSGGGFDALKSCLGKPKSMCGQTLGESDQNQDLEYWDACGEWYEEKGISREMFAGFQQSKGFNIGDIFVLRKAEDVEVGDVIVYDNKISKAPIIHRLVEVKEDESVGRYYKTKGDYNVKSYGFEEKIEEGRVYGKVLLKVPYLGWVKIVFNMLLKMLGVI